VLGVCWNWDESGVAFTLIDALPLALFKTSAKLTEVSGLPLKKSLCLSKAS